MNYMFGKNMFSEYSKKALEAMFKDIRKCEKEALISNCLVPRKRESKSGAMLRAQGSTILTLSAWLKRVLR